MLQQRSGLSVSGAPVLIVLVLFGCGGSESAKDASDASSAVRRPSKAVGPALEGRPTGRDPENAAASVRAVIDGLRENRPQAVWEFFPASYQRDINRLARDFADRMDPELWRRAFGFARRVVRLCRERKEAILASPAFAQTGIDVEVLRRRWDDALGLAEAILNSDLADLEKLKGIDGGEFLAGTGSEAMRRLAALAGPLATGEPGERTLREVGRPSKAGPTASEGRHTRWEALEEMKVEQVSSQENAAVVKITAADGDEPVEVEFVRVEGKWIPRSLAESWDESFAEFRRNLLVRLDPEVLAANKRAMLQALDQMEPVLARLEQARTDEQFRQILAKTRLIEWLTGVPTAAVGSSGPVVPPVPVQTGDARSRQVTVVIPQRLDQRTADQLAEKLFELGPALDVAPPVFGERETRITISPVDDVRVFSRLIRFAEVANVDPEKRTITLQP